MYLSSLDVIAIIMPLAVSRQALIPGEIIKQNVSRELLFTVRQSNMKKTLDILAKALYTTSEGWCHVEQTASSTLA